MASKPGWRSLADRTAIRLALLWAGISIGVAFVATPAKFLAPSLELSVALDIGRQTFRVYNGLELVLAALATALSLGSTEPWRRARGFAVPVAVVLIQALWLIPALDARTQLVQAGRIPPLSHLHAVYILAEGLKIIALVGAALAVEPAWSRASRHGYDDAVIPAFETAGCRGAGGTAASD